MPFFVRSPGMIQVDKSSESFRSCWRPHRGGGGVEDAFLLGATVSVSLWMLSPPHDPAVD
jgi:hypothetical protein